MGRISCYLAAACLVAACAINTPQPPPTPPASPSPATAPVVAPAPLPASVNLDAATQALIARTRRAVFLVPFSHWDTDWHSTFDSYAGTADRNILDAIRLARHEPRFRYAVE